MCSHLDGEISMSNVLSFEWRCRTHAQCVWCARNGSGTMDVEWCVRTLQRVCSDLAVCVDGRSVDLDSHSTQLQLVHRELVAAELLGQHVAPALECVRELFPKHRTFLEYPCGQYDGGCPSII